MPTTSRSRTQVRIPRPPSAASWFLALSLLAVPSSGATEELNRVVLRVNDRIVTLFDYQARLDEQRSAILRSQADPQERAKSLESLGREALRDLLDESLLLSRGDQLAVEITPEQIEEGMAQARRNYGVDDPQEFAKALESSGMSEAEFRTRVRDNLIYQDVLSAEVTSRIKVDDEALRRFYREHEEQFRVPARSQLREIVVLDKEGMNATDQAASTAALHAQLAAGKTLEEVAAAAPAGTVSSVIDLGWVRSADLDPQLAAAIESLAPGSYSEPVRGRGGLHILQLVAREESRLRPFEEVEADLRAGERQRRFRDALETYMKELEGKALIVASPPPEAAGFRRETASAPTDEWQTLTGVPTAPAAPAPGTPPGLEKVPTEAPPAPDTSAPLTTPPPPAAPAAPEAVPAPTDPPPGAAVGRAAQRQL